MWKNTWKWKINKLLPSTPQSLIQIYGILPVQFPIYFLFFLAPSNLFHCLLVVQTFGNYFDLPLYLLKYVNLICRCPLKLFVGHWLMKCTNNLIHGSTRSSIFPFNTPFCLYTLSVYVQVPTHTHQGISTSVLCNNTGYVFSSRGLII